MRKFKTMSKTKLMTKPEAMTKPKPKPSLAVASKSNHAEAKPTEPDEYNQYFTHKLTTLIDEEVSSIQKLKHFMLHGHPSKEALHLSARWWIFQGWSSNITPQQKASVSGAIEKCKEEVHSLAWSLEELNGRLKSIENITT